MRIASAWAMALVPLVVASLAGQAKPPNPEIKFRGDGLIKLGEGPTPSPVILIVEGTNLPELKKGQQPPSLTLSDVAAGTPPGMLVQFSQIDELASPAVRNARHWKTLVTVSGMAAHAELKRVIGLKLGGSSYLANLTLDNRVSGEFTWSVAQPQNLFLEQSRRTSVAVTTGARPATNVRIVQSSLQDANSKMPLGTEYLTLEGGSRIAEKSTTEVAVHVKPGFVRPGTFTGSLAFAVDQQAATQAVNLTVYSSSNWLRAWGVASIALGIAVYICLGVFAKNRANQLEALRAAAVLRDQLPGLNRTLSEAAKKAPDIGSGQLRKRLDEVEAGLSQAHLKTKGLPALFVPNSEKQATSLGEHLAEVAKLVRVLNEIVGRGIETVLRRWDVANPDPYKKALEALDDLADPAKELSAVRTKVSEILTGVPSVRTRGRPGAEEPEKRSAGQISVELEHLWSGIWFGWAVITTAAGFVALVLSNPGFGTGLDLAACFFWGVGLQVAGQQLQQLSPNRLATRLSLPMPEEE